MVRTIVTPKERRTRCIARRYKGDDDGCNDDSLTDASITSPGCDESIELTEKMVSINASTILFLFHNEYVLMMKNTGKFTSGMRM